MHVEFVQRLTMDIHSFNSDFYSLAEIKDYLKKWTVKVGTCSTFFKHPVIFLRITDRVMQFSYFILPFSLFSLSKLYLARRSKSKSTLTSFIYFENYSYLRMNSLIGKKGFLLFFCFFWIYRFVSLDYWIAYVSGLVFIYSTKGSVAFFVDILCILNASGNFELAFLAILGLAI